ncbi:MAG: HzsA-related protein [Planctomycetota bacterium]|jgi:hypothetical protein
MLRSNFLSIILKVAWGLVVVLAAFCVPAAGEVQGRADSWLGPAPSGAAYPAGEADRRFASLSRDLKQRGQVNRFESETFRKEAMILEADRDPLDVILRRSEALLADIVRMPEVPKLEKMAAELSALRGQADKVDVKNAAERRAIFETVCHLRRRIAFTNPLLDFNEILIIKRLLPAYNHMCDQYYGLAQRPGGGLYILSDPFGAKPQIRNLLDKSVVANGRLKGQKLSGGPKRLWKLRYNGMGSTGGEKTEGGSFLSPDLSFDAGTVAFAYVECSGDRGHRYHTDPGRGHWAKERSYHIFSVGIDGSDLRMLTDGTWNDFDPCFMPSGRIALITERRGGYLRCGRVCPTYTLYDMAADGSGIKCLSFHETNEWHPSITNDGMIIWTRWDYVDRHGQIAHFPWITTPDGRDPRAVHGNYSTRSKRPDMEVDVRAIPGSHKFVAVAAPHHGQSFGSMVIIDPRAEDDDAMGPVKRLTPEVGFPESQANKRTSLIYGQPWPLSEDYYLCAYEPDGKASSTTMYGIYLVDTFGNKELIYRDPSIASQSPIPVKPRPKPPVIPEMSERLDANPVKGATVGVVNVYNTRMPLPKGTKITTLRVYQVFPLSVASARVTHSTGCQIPQAKDSINLARAVLGTVPVEKDGSAHFIVPSGKELFFQALDENGLAITSMRSGTHFQPGERTICQGCHEPKYGVATTPSKSVTMAMRRAPSQLKPEADGTNPFSYPRLIQPILDKHCVKCHAENKDNKDKTKRTQPLDAQIVRTSRGSYMNPKTAYYVSYLSLAPRFGFYDYGGKSFNDRKWYRTTPGKFGARASNLYELLRKGHYKVKLSPEEMRRITVWLDSCSPFYGVYEKEGGEAQLRGEVARPTIE